MTCRIAYLRERYAPPVFYATRIAALEKGQPSLDIENLLRPGLTVTPRMFMAFGTSPPSRHRSTGWLETYLACNCSVQDGVAVIGAYARLSVSWLQESPKWEGFRSITPSSMGNPEV